MTVRLTLCGLDLDEVLCGAIKDQWQIKAENSLQRELRNGQPRNLVGIAQLGATLVEACRHTGEALGSFLVRGFLCSAVTTSKLLPALLVLLVCGVLLVLYAL